MIVDFVCEEGGCASLSNLSFRWLSGVFQGGGDGLGVGDGLGGGDDLGALPETANPAKPGTSPASSGLRSTGLHSTGLRSTGNSWGKKTCLWTK